MKIGVMLRTLDEKKGIGIYTQNLMDSLLLLDTKNEYVLFYYNPKLIGRYGHFPHVREKVVWAPLGGPLLRRLSFPDLSPYKASKAIWDQLKIPVEAEREGVDLMFSPTDSIPLSAHCKTIMVLHGAEWLVYPEWFKLIDRIYIRIMMRLYCNKADRLLANSEVTKRNFVSILRIGEDKIKTTHLAFDPQFKRIDDDIYLKRKKEKYQLPEEFILYVGRIHPGKNFGNLVQGFAKIQRSIPHKLVVVGHPRWGYRSDLATIERLGLEEEILFAGWVPQEDLVAFYNLADLFILPSLYEAFGIPVLEAMACGCPVITSNTGAPPEIAGDAALFVDPRDVDGIAEGMTKVLSDDPLRWELSKRGLHRAQAFSWEKCAKETLATIEECLGST